MKATKKIVGAACALVAAVALSAGSTFAWFAQNSEVTATGMHVQATVPTNLYIAKNYVAGVDGVNETTISLATSADSLKPAAVSADEVTGATIKDGSTKESGVEKLYVEEAATYDEGKKPSSSSSGTAATYTDIGTLTPDVGTSNKAVWAGEKDGVTETSTYAQDKYVYTADMTLANKSNKADIDATVTITWGNAVNTDTFKFIRVGFLIGTLSDTTWSYEYISLANDITTGEGGAVTSGTNYVYATGSTGKTITVEYASLISDFESNSVRTITFLAWFDGNDEECYVNNAVEVGELTLELHFEAVAPKSGSGS